MIRKEEIKAMGNIIYSSYLLRSNAHNFAATQLYNAGWRKQIEAEWKPYIEYYADDYSECNTRKVWTCSRCGRLEKQKEPYCNCGAKMVQGR